MCMCVCVCVTGSSLTRGCCSPQRTSTWSGSPRYALFTHTHTHSHRHTHTDTHRRTCRSIIRKRHPHSLTCRCLRPMAGCMHTGWLHGCQDQAKCVCVCVRVCVCVCVLCIQAGFTDVKIKRIGPQWYRGVRRHGLIMGCSVTGVKPKVCETGVKHVCVCDMQAAPRDHPESPCVG